MRKVASYQTFMGQFDSICSVDGVPPLLPKVISPHFLLKEKVELKIHSGYFCYNFFFSLYSFILVLCFLSP